MEQATDSPFSELPEALVEEMLNQCDNLGQELSRSFQELFDRKEEVREKLKKMIKTDRDITFAPSHPTSCGVDGSYAIEKLLSTDIVAMAGVAVEGLAPPTEKRHWPKPRHFSNVLTVSHRYDSTNIVRAIMMAKEIQLACRAPHDIVFFDGSLTIPVIYFNQAFNSLKDSPKKLVDLFMKGNGEFKNIVVTFESFYEILRSPRSDKLYVGLPKYTTKSEIAEMLNMHGHEDRSLLTFTLKPGEYIGPLALKKKSDQDWHLNNIPKEIEKIASGVIDAVNNLNVIYYRPYDNFPVLRIECSSSVAENNQRLALLFESLRLQCGAPGIIEPYPLYLADRMVKHLRTALPALRKTTTQEMSLKWEEKIGNMYLAMHGYRTEFGK